MGMSKRPQLDVLALPAWLFAQVRCEPSRNLAILVPGVDCLAGHRRAVMRKNGDLPAFALKLLYPLVEPCQIVLVFIVVRFDGPVSDVVEVIETEANVLRRFERNAAEQGAS